jgi:hypothetical protein
LNGVIGMLDINMKALKDTRPVLKSFLENIQSNLRGVSDKKGFCDVVRNAIAALPPDGHQYLQSLIPTSKLETELGSHLDKEGLDTVLSIFSNVTVNEVMRLYDAYHDMASEILKGLRGVRN